MNASVEDPEDRQTPGWENEVRPDGGTSQPDLTPRQLEILSLIARGRTNKEIAVVLGISERTVKFHVASLFRKLCTVSRTEALVVALKLKLIQIDYES
ncbi:MAG TPA: response regulator transcription factor [Dehalococcoidia bacterium]